MALKHLLSHICERNANYNSAWHLNFHLLNCQTLKVSKPTLLPKLRDRGEAGMLVCVHAQSCLTLCNPGSPPGSSVHGIFQARILEWVVISYFRGSSPPRDQTCVSCIGRQILYHCATWEAQVESVGRYIDKTPRKEISLVVQWLRLPMEGAWVQSLVREIVPTCLNKD